ncbi:MAG: hypothetical protein ABSA41_11725 [Terriglobia bacterium]
MKTRVTIALSVVSVLAVALAFGQSQAAMGRLDIPFKFMVGKKEMPAGKYEFVKQTGQQSALLLRNVETSKAIFVPVLERLAETSPQEKHKARVVFDTVGDQKFLSEFWPPDNEDGYLVGITKGEEKHEVLTQN